MKKLIKYLVVVSCIISILIVSSCRTTKEVTITGIPHTTIYTKDRYKIGTIGPDGTAKIVLDAENYFYLSKAPGSNMYIPFATNVNDKFHVCDGADEFGFVDMALSFVVVLTAGLTAPLVYQPDKPLNTSTNDDLFLNTESSGVNGMQNE